MFHSNPKAGVEIKDLLNCHKRQPLDALRTAISEAQEAQKAERKKMKKTLKMVGNSCLFIKIQKQNFD